MSMVSKVGYDFYFYDQTESSRLVLFPITPPKLEVTVGSRNETVELINEGQVNLLKSPALIDIEFQARFPSQEYPFSRYPKEYEEYFAIFNSLKENKIPFRFIMIRGSVYNRLNEINPSLYRKTRNSEAANIKNKIKQIMSGVTQTASNEDDNSFGESNYNILCAIEEMKITEDANEGHDILVDFKLRQWKPYGLKVFKVKGDNTTTSSSEVSRTVLLPVSAQIYTVKADDDLTLITRKFYGTFTYELRQRIYDANENIIESVARQHGRMSSQNGYWLYEGTVLTIPVKG